MSFTNIDVQELAGILEDENNPRQLIDVREEQEASIAFIRPFQLLPLSKSQEWMERIAIDFDPELETIVLCHHGIRSAQMSQWLVSQGFSNVKNVSGGIDAYSLLIDRSVPRY